jgi:hypothetical protein
MRDPEGVLMRDLELLGRAVAYPPTPSLTGAVAARLSPRPAGAPAWGLAGVALATAVVVVALVAGTIGPAREAMADLFDRINIFEVADVPAELPTDIRGEPVSLDEAKTRLKAPIEIPAHPEGLADSLTEVLFQDLRPGEMQAVALFFEPPDGAPFVLFQTNAHAGKGLGPGASAERVTGLGREAYWLEGLRIVQLYDSQGNFLRESERRTEANTLLWANEDGFVRRIEGDLTKEEAVRIAQSLR